MFFLPRHFSRTQTHTHPRARFNMDVFQRTGFYTEIVVRRNTFTQRCFHTEMAHTETLLHTHTFIQRSFYAEQLYTQIPSHTEVLLQRNGFTRGAFIYGCFCTGILLHDFRRRARISRYKSSASRCKTAISPQLLAIETHFVGTG